MAIGDDLQILLGMVPIRDRAGIARGTMADAAVAAANPHANGQELTRQGFDFARPPALSLPPSMGQDVQLPDGVNTEYTSGSGGRAMSPAKPPLKQPLPPPEPTERVIASSPAAAPSPEVVRGSDVLMKAYEQQQRQQRMQAIIQSIGGMVSSLQGQPVHGGGGAAAGGPDLNSLKTIIDMRNAENQQAAALAIRKQTIEELQRTNGYSPEYAAAKYDSGEYKDDLKQDTIAKREAAKLAGTTREALLKPENVDALSKRLGQPPDVIRADIRNGKLGAKDLADIESTQATTQGTQATTGKVAGEASRAAIDFGNRQDALRHPEVLAAKLTDMLKRPVSPTEISTGALTDESWRDLVKQYSQAGQAAIEGTAAKAAKERADTARALGEDAHRADVVAHPEQYAGLYKGTSPEQLANYAKTQGGWSDFLKGQAPSLDALQQQYWTTVVPQALAEGKKPPSFSDWKIEQTKASVPVPEDLITKGAVEHHVNEMAKSAAAARTARADIIDRHSIQELWNPTNIQGGWGAENQENLRMTVARLFGRPDEDASNSKLFFSALGKLVQGSGKTLPGPLSDKDLMFLRALEGGREIDPEGMRHLQIIHEKWKLAEIAAHNKYHEETTSKPDLAGLKRFYQTYDSPGPGRFLKEEMQDQPQDVEMLMKHKDDPRMIAKFDRSYGHGNAAWVIAHDGKID